MHLFFVWICILLRLYYFDNCLSVVYHCCDIYERLLILILYIVLASNILIVPGLLIAIISRILTVLKNWSISWKVFSELSIQSNRSNTFKFYEVNSLFDKSKISLTCLNPSHFQKVNYILFESSYQIIFMLTYSLS